MSRGDWPKQLGSYDVEYPLAEGGMGQVLLGRLDGADGFRKEVVIKRLLPHLVEDEDFVNMFRDEARITSQLHHANIAQVLEFVEADDELFLVLEYVAGTNLAQVIDTLYADRDFLSIPEVAHVISSVAHALDYAHRKTGADGQSLGIIHRDVSPANVLLSHEGQVKLTDFGIARAKHRLSCTQAGLVKGKSAYMAPECIMLGTEIDSRSDLFALGAVLYESLTGVAAFRGQNDAETIMRVTRARLDPPSVINPDVPAELDELVAALTEIAPEDRPQRGLEVVRALAPFVLADEPPEELLGVTIENIEDRTQVDLSPEVVTAVTKVPAFKTVLVVDDSDERRAAIGAALGPDYLLAEADAVEVAEAFLATQEPAAVICRHDLAGTPGIELCLRMRAGPAADVPFILICFDGDQALIERAEAAGVDAVLPEDFDPGMLAEDLDAIVA